MALELFAGLPADAGTDLYAVGVTLYHLLTRHYPYGEMRPLRTRRTSLADRDPQLLWRSILAISLVLNLLLFYLLVAAAG